MVTRSGSLLDDFASEHRPISPALLPFVPPPHKGAFTLSAGPASRSRRRPGVVALLFSLAASDGCRMRTSLQPGCKSTHEAGANQSPRLPSFAQGLLPVLRPLHEYRQLES